MPIAHVNGIDLYYEEHGTGEALLLIAGLGANATLWSRNIPTLVGEFRVVAFDNRGAGRSEKPEGPYSIALFVDDTVALMDHLGIASAHIYGESMGGFIAQETALRHPSRVRGLVLGCTTPGGPRAVAPPPASGEVLARLPSLTPEEAFEKALPVFYHPSYLKEHLAEVIEWGQRFRQYRTTPEAYARQLEACLAFDAYDRLPQVKVPTLVINGEEDALLPVENCRLIARQIPGAELVLFPGVGHLYFIEVQEQADAVVIDFLRRCSGRGA